MCHLLILKSNQELTHKHDINLGFEIGMSLALLIIQLGLTLRSVGREANPILKIIKFKKSNFNFLK